MKYHAGKLMLQILMSMAVMTVQAQQPQKPEIHVPMAAESWAFSSDAVDFQKIGDRPSMRIKNDTSLVTLNNTTFGSGTIEFDIQPPSEGFSSVYFRQQSTAERECLYFRTGKNRNIEADDAVQYAPFIDGVNLWDLFPEYQSDASLKAGKWNHVKMIISGKQMRVYINDTLHAALAVPFLEGNTQTGAIAFDGRSLLSNLVIRPGVTAGLSPVPETDITDNNPRYIRNWEVSKNVVTMAWPIGFDAKYMPDSNTVWEPIKAERKGMVNLTRRFGGERKRSLVWLKSNIYADSDINKILRFGFCDEVWAFLNGQVLYIGRNYFNSLTMKRPNGRISLENTTLNLPLKKGNNELLIGVANAFYGWGIIAQLTDNSGVLINK